MKNRYIHNMRDLAKELGISSNKGVFAEVERTVYKESACGIIISKIPRGIALSSIVEGVDASTNTFDLKYPFTMARFNAYCDEVHNEANQIWDETHGCEKCGPEDERGYRHINPKCKHCKGEGVIL